MNFTEAELDNLSTLARITVSKEEKPKMLADMQAILGYISEINEVVTDTNTRPIDTLQNVVREDVVTNDTGSKSAAILEEAPAIEGNYVKVIQVLK